MSTFIEDTTDKYEELKNMLTYLSENKEMNLDDLQSNIDNLNDLCEQIVSQKKRITPINLRDVVIHLIHNIERERKKLYNKLAKENESFSNLVSYNNNPIVIDYSLVELHNLSKMQGRLKAFLLGKKLLYKDLKPIVKLNPFVENLFDSYFEELLKVEN
jgi:hypothetical protein